MAKSPTRKCARFLVFLLGTLHGQLRILGSSYHLIRIGCYLDNILTFICRATDVILKPIQMVLAHFFSFYCAIIMCILLYVRPCAFSQLNADARKKFEFFASGFICAPSKFWVLLFLPWPGSCKCQSLLAIFLILHVYELGFIEAIVKEFCCLILFLLVLIYLHMSSCCISVGSICKGPFR